jgi:DNA-binding NarL/FixJ family response regulator
MPEETIKTILVEDHEITRLGIRKMLERLADVEIIAEATDGKSAVDKAIELNPALILMDIGLPLMDGIQATKLIKAAMPVKIIMITSHEMGHDIFAALSAGADAYCLKGVSVEQLNNAIHAVVSGAVWLDPGIAKQVVSAANKGSQNTGPDHLQNNIFQLSEREYQVLTLLVDGFSNQQMADRLFLSIETVKTHMRHVMEKLRVSDRTQAAIKAVKHNLVSAPDKR